MLVKTLTGKPWLEVRQDYAALKRQDLCEDSPPLEVS